MKYFNDIQAEVEEKGGKHLFNNVSNTGGMIHVWMIMDGRVVAFNTERMKVDPELAPTSTIVGSGKCTLDNGDTERYYLRVEDRWDK